MTGFFSQALADQRAYGPNWTSRQATVALVDARDEIKWNIDAVDALIRSQLVNLFDYDKFLAACLEGIYQWLIMILLLYH